MTAYPEFSTRPLNNLRTIWLCAASSNSLPHYQELAENIGRMIGENGYDYVYGGGEIGLMGISRKAAEAAGSKITSVITSAFANMSGELGADTMVLERLHDRKFAMLSAADVVAAIPGGVGTDDEVFEGMGQNDMKRFGKLDENGNRPLVDPIILVNSLRHFDGLLEKSKRNLEDGTANIEKYRCLYVVRDEHEFIRLMAELNQSPQMYGQDLMKGSERPPGPKSFADKIIEDERVAAGYAREFGFPPVTPRFG